MFANRVIYLSIGSRGILFVGVRADFFCSAERTFQSENNNQVVLLWPENIYNSSRGGGGRNTFLQRIHIKSFSDVILIQASAC